MINGMPDKNQQIELEITDMTHEGSGVGHFQGMAIFVPNTAVGDLADTRIVKVCKSHCFGKAERILRPSPDRADPDCPVYKRCGGCVFRHITYEAELRCKARSVQENLRRIGGIDLECEPIEPSPAWEGYRNKAQYPVRMQGGKLCAGFFAMRTHEVVDSSVCALQPPAFATVVETVLAFLREHGIPAYDETTGTGLLRHLYLRQGAHSNEMMLCLVVNGSAIPKTRELIDRLLETEPNLVSIVLSSNTARTNVILGPKTRVLYGKETISDTMCGLRFDLAPAAFYQVNTPAAERLYGLAAEYAGLTGKETLLDLYCGAGTIGLSMAHNAKEVIGVELVGQAVENAASNAASNDIHNARFFQGDAAEAAARLAEEGIRPDVVILDPPRKGCEESLLHTVAKMGPKRIVYISCNSATLARDCALFEKLGYRAQRCRPVDLFPRTAHCEVVTQMAYCGDKAKK